MNLHLKAVNVRKIAVDIELAMNGINKIAETRLRGAPVLTMVLPLPRQKNNGLSCVARR